MNSCSAEDSIIILQVSDFPFLIIYLSIILYFYLVTDATIVNDLYVGCSCRARSRRAGSRRAGGR